MSLIKAEKLSKSYGPKLVLHHATFSIDRGQKIALVGNNGTGKTTLLKILAGIEQSDFGKLQITNGTVIGYLPQDTSIQTKKTILEYILETSEIDYTKSKYKVDAFLSGFGLDEIDVNNSFNSLSSGQKTKIVLIAILLKNVDVLVLDEPTNNLDLPALIWLENYLKQSGITCLIVSHDRRFLDQITTKIMEVDWITHKISINNGKYSDYIERVKKQLRRQKEEYKMQQEEMMRLRQLANMKREHAARGAKYQGTDNDRMLRGYRRDKAGDSLKDAKVFLRRIKHMDKLEKPIERDPLFLNLESQILPGSCDIKIEDAISGYENFKIGPISLDIKYGNRIVIMGLNGSGKTTLLKTITGNLELFKGSIEIGSGIKIGNMMQEHETLPRNISAVDFLRKRTQVEEEDAFNKLQVFGFDEFQSRAKIRDLSPGGRARLLFALFSLELVNVLVLDEPTNHLDVEAQEALEDAMSKYQGTVILVSHDRYFIEKTNLDSIYILDNKTLERVSNYDEYLKTASEKAKKLVRVLK